MSAAILPFLTSGIDPLPERFDAEPLYRVDEEFVGTLAQRQIGFNDIFDHVGDFAVSHGGADQDTKFGVLVGTAADRDLIKFLAVLLDAQNADMADMMVAAGVDAAGNVDMQPADQFRGIVIGKTAGQLLRNRNRTRIGQRTIIQSRTGDDVGDQVDVGRSQPELVERLPQRGKVALWKALDKLGLATPNVNLVSDIIA